MGFVDRLTGKTAADAAREGAQLQAAAGERALERFEPFRQIGLQGIEQAGFLTDPQAQFDFLQGNPLFQASLEQAQTGTQNIAAARGRLSAGDTLQQLSQNVLLSASPLIQQQKQSIADLINVGSGTAGAQGGLITDIGATQAGGVIGAEQARGAGASNLLNLGATAALAPISPTSLAGRAFN